MSHFSSIKTKGNLTNAQILAEALNELKIQNVSVHETPQKLRDYYQVRGMSPRSQQTAEVVIPYENNDLTSDAGFKEVDGEFELVGDEMDLARLKRRLESLQSHYAAINVEQQLALITKAANGKNRGKAIVERQQLPDGTTVVRLALPGNIRIANQNQQVIH